MWVYAYQIQPRRGVWPPSVQEQDGGAWWGQQTNLLCRLIWLPGLLSGHSLGKSPTLRWTSPQSKRSTRQTWPTPGFHTYLTSQEEYKSETKETTYPAIFGVRSTNWRSATLSHKLPHTLDGCRYVTKDHGLQTCLRSRVKRAGGLSEGSLVPREKWHSRTRMSAACWTRDNASSIQHAQPELALVT